MYGFIAANIEAVLAKAHTARRLSSDFRRVLETPYLPTRAQIASFSETISMMRGAGVTAARGALSELSRARYWIEVVADPQADWVERDIGREESIHWLTAAEAALERLTARLSN